MGQRSRVLRMAVAVVLVAAGVWVCWRVAQKPVISVDYLKKFNEMRRPADYRAEDDGGGLYMQACMALEKLDYPEIKRDEEIITRPGDMTPEELQVVKTWLADHNDVLTIAGEALAKKYWYVQRSSKDGTMMNVQMPELMGMRNLCYSFIWRGKMKALAGDVKGGVEDVMMPAEIGRMLSERPCLLIEQELAIGATDRANKNVMEIASRCAMSSRELARLAEKIERAGEPYKSVDNGLEGARLRFYDAVQRCFSDDGHGDGRPLALALANIKDSWLFHEGDTRLSVRLAEGLARHSFALEIVEGSEGRKAMLERFDRMMSKTREVDAEQPWQFKAKGDEPGRWFEKERRANKFVELFAPALERAVFSHHRYLARMEGTLATIAVLRYKLEKGTLPEGWEEVVHGGYVKEMPMDRFSGKPLVYKKTDDGFTVYSVGEDWNDDGGDRKNDIVIWPAK